MFAFVSAFPKSLHCTDEAQQAETVLSAVLSITLLLLRAGKVPVFPRQRYRAVQWFHCCLRGQMYPTSIPQPPSLNRRDEHLGTGFLV